MRILFYAINGIGIGHLVRCLILAKEIVKRNPDTKVLFVTNSPFTELIRNGGFEFVQLPLNKKDPIARFNTGQKLIDAENYNSIFKKVVGNYNPDVMVWDNRVEEEIVRFSDGLGVKNILILRKYDNETLKEFITSGFGDYFCSIIVPHQKEEFQYCCPEIYKKIEKEKKYIFTGPITRIFDSNQFEADNLKEKYGVKEGDFVIVCTFGGGGHKASTPALMREVYKSYDMLKKRIKNLKLIFVTGPFFDGKIGKKGDTISVKFEPNLMQLMRLSSIAISQGGYNTVNEAITTRTPTLFVPIEVICENQRERLIEIERNSLGWIIEKASAKKISEKLIELCGNRKEVERIRNNLARYKQTYGNNNAVKEILKYGKKDGKKSYTKFISFEGRKPKIVLCYHSFNSEGGHSLSFDEFKEQIQLMQKQGFKLTPVSKAITTEDIGLTFDDGDKSVYKLAYPFLKKKGIKGTLFVSTAYIGKKGFLSWQELKNMYKSGWEVQSHGVLHPHLYKRYPSETEKEYEKRIGQEIYQSKKKIESKLKQKVDYFAYPYGMGNELIRKIGKKIGYKHFVNAENRLNFEENEEISRISIIKSLNIKKLLIKSEYAKVKIGGSCNNNCDKCDKNTELRELIHIKRAVEEARSLSDNIIISGREPAIRADIFEIVKYCKYMGFKKIGVESNGRVFYYKDFCERMVGAGVDFFRIYLFSRHSNVHDAVTKTKGSFTQTLKGIENLLRLKARVEIIILDYHNKTSKIIANAEEFLKEIRNTDSPEVITIKLSTICNAKCSMCNYWDRNSWKLSSLSTSKVRAIIREAGELGFKEIRISGGEPTLRKDLVGIIDYAKSFGFKVLITTNGSLLDERLCRKLRNVGIDEIMLSIDSISPKVHDKMRGFNGLLSKALEGIANLHKENLTMMINTVISKLNYLELEKIMELARTYGISNVSLTQISPFSRLPNSRLRLNRKEMEEFYFFILPNLLKKVMEYKIKLTIKPIFKIIVPYSENLGLDIKETREVISLLRNKGLFKEEIKNFSRGDYGLSFYKNRKCFIDSREVFVMANGDVMPCCTAMPLKKGLNNNINKKRLKEVLCSKDYNSFFSDAGRYNICKICKEFFDYNYMKNR